MSGVRQGLVRSVEAHEDGSRPVPTPGQDSEREGRRRRRQGHRRRFDANQEFVRHRNVADVIAGLKINSADNAESNAGTDGEQQQRRQEERRRRQQRRKQQVVEEQAQELPARQGQDVVQLHQVREKAEVGQKLRPGNRDRR